MKCAKCKIKIPRERLDVIPDTKTCVKCSDIEPLFGITVWDKTTPELLIVDEATAQRFWKLERLDGRLGRLK